MAFLLIALFIVVPIAELYVIIQVGELIGLWPTLFLLFADAVLGSLLLKHQGRGAWRRFNEALAARRFPAREAADGALIVLGGALLLAPGFITDVFGIFLLIPPTRAIARGLLGRLAIGRFAVVNVGAPGPFTRRDGGVRPSGTGHGPSREYDFDATAEELPEDGNERQLPRTDPH